VRIHRVAAVGGDARERPFERAVLERLHPAARPADEMVMVMVMPTVGEDALVAGDTVTDLDALNEP